MKAAKIRKEPLVFRIPPFRIVHAETLRNAFEKAGIGHVDFWKKILYAKYKEEISPFGYAHDDRIMLYHYNDGMKKFLSENNVKYEP